MEQAINLCDVDSTLAAAEELLERRDLAGAFALFNRAESIGADCDRCAGGRWLANMLCGNFTAAWKESDAIRGRGKPDPHRFWNGEDLHGKRVMVRCLHGFGDAIQMLRYLPKLQALAGKVIVEVAPRLVDIAPYFKGIGDVITWGEHAPTNAPKFGVQMEIMELPYIFRTDLAELPVATKYVSIPEQAETSVARIMGIRERPRIGIVWSAGGWNASRRLPFDFVQKIVEVPDVQFWSLQGGRENDAWSSLICEDRRDAVICGDGILTLAAVMNQLDLVLTVDTMAAHLAGALGKPAWVLLQYAADWRWMVERDGSPWYPSLRLYRQATPGDWGSLAENVQTDLKCWRP